MYPLAETLARAHRACGVGTGAEGPPRRQVAPERHGSSCPEPPGNQRGLFIDVMPVCVQRNKGTCDGGQVENPGCVQDPTARSVRQPVPPRVQSRGRQRRGPRRQITPKSSPAPVQGTPAGACTQPTNATCPVPHYVRSHRHTPVARCLGPAFTVPLPARRA